MDAGHVPDHTALIRRRITEWRRTGDLGRLWPDVSAGELRAAHRQVRAATGTVLAAGLEGPLRLGENRAGTETPPPPGRGPSAVLATGGEREDRALGIAAFASGMGALLSWWIRDGRIDASPGARDVLAPHLEHGRRRVGMLQERLAHIVRAARAEGIDPVVLKGLHTGVGYFPHPGTRPAADVDLLVRREDRPRAARALAAAGFTESRRTRFAARSEWVPAGELRTVHSLELEHAEDPWSVDLHTSLERWYFRGLRRGLGGGWVERTGELRVGPEAVRVLGQPDLTAFLALHASYELVKVRLVRIVELVLVVRDDLAKGRLDWAELEELLEETGTLRFVHPALALAETLAPGTVDPDLLARTGRRTTARTHRVLATVREADMAPLMRRSLDAKLMWARGPGELLLALSELLVPSDEGLEVGLARLHLRRLAAVLHGDAGWRAGGDGGTMES